jgi:tetratricopeptide (TPR) repeat protein
MGRRFVFDHHQVQEALYQGTPQLLREPYHARLAETLERRYADRGEVPPGDVAVQLCEHALCGLDHERAARWLPAAAQHLRDGYLHDDAIVLTRRVLEVDGLLRGSRRIDALLSHSEDLEMRGRHDEDRRVLREALMLADADGDPVRRARVRTHLGRLCIWSTQLKQARAWLEEAIALALEGGDSQAATAARGNLGIVLYRQRRFRECRPLFEQAYEAARATSNERGMAVAMLNLGNVFWCLGEFEQAQSHYERYADISRRIGYREGEALAAGNLGNVLWSTGHVAEARRRYEQVLAISDEIGDMHKVALFEASLAKVEVCLGRPDRARPHAKRSLFLARDMGMPREEAVALHAMGVIENSLDRFHEALEICRRVGIEEEEVTILLEIARREPDARVGHLEAALAVARHVGHATYEALTLAMMGRAAEAEECLANSDVAIGEYTRMELLFRLHEATGERTPLDEAAGLLERFVGFAPEEDRETMRSGNVLHRAISTAVTRARSCSGDAGE